ncbi:DUF1348 family protein [Methyloprofundus sp.]|uniref:DUF1348 family protein n=1 Tax=Methyloprofundus sp. TaxID=2020875 RepID=UPI003D112F6F
MENRPPLPPFSLATATQKVQLAEDGWNSKNPTKVASAYTLDCQWRNRAEIFSGRKNIIEFLTRKWDKELEYRLKKELWSYTGNRIAVTFRYEWHDASGQWFRSYGNELWEFAGNGLMQRRIASINDKPMNASERELY